MEAIYTTTGMQIVPYRPKAAKMILSARSVWTNRGPKPVTAFVETDKDGTDKRLLTYKCHPDWLKKTIPSIVISTMPKNTVTPINDVFALNPDIIPNDIQSSTTKAVLNHNFKTAFFNIPTGVGKTLLAIYLTGILGVKAWAMCYSTTVLAQWLDTIVDKTTMGLERVYTVNKSATLMQMIDGSFPVENYDFYLSTGRVLMNFAKRYGFDLLNEAFNACGIGVKFFDEAHYDVANIVKINALTNVDRTYYLSADFDQTNKENQKLYYRMFSHVPIIKPGDDIIRDMRYTIGVVVRYNTHPSFNDVQNVFGGYGFDRFRYMEYQFNRDQFYDAYSQTLQSIWRADGYSDYKIMILCNLIEQVDFLKEWTEAYFEKVFPENLPKIVRYHSEMTKEEKVDALEHGKIIISTYKSMGVGIDLRLIRHVISLVPIGRLEDNQAAGRARALPGGQDCFYYMFVDDGFEYVRKKLPERLSYLEQQKIKDLVSIKYN